MVIYWEVGSSGPGSKGFSISIDDPLRGGSWNNAGNAGLGALNLNNARSNANSNVGLRLALV